MTAEFTPSTQADQTDQAELEKLKALHERRFARERMARKAAEQLLEQKSAELYELNQALHQLTDELEDRINERTLELEKERNLALELSRTKSDFLATMSHEIRTPINGIIGVLKLLENDELPRDEAHKLLTIAQHSSHTLLNIINDILDFSRIESGKLEIESVPFALPETFKKILHPFDTQAAEKNLTLKFNCPENLQLNILGDPLRITQVVNNFLSNAFKFTPNGEIILSVTLTEQKRLRIEVCDSGIGIPEDKQNRLFKDFSQVDSSTSRKYGSTGLGLIISKRIIELMQGVIGYQPNHPKGSCFFAEIPYRPVTIEPSQTTDNTNHERLETSDRSLKLLLVDDNEVNRLIGSKILQRLGHTVTIASSGFEAIEYCADAEFDVILMDIQMPDLDGYETTKILRQTLSTPIIALTANTSLDDRQKALAVGMNDFLSKPFDIAKIKQTLGAIQ